MKRRVSYVTVGLVVCLCFTGRAAGPSESPSAISFAVIGDFDTGTPHHTELARTMADLRDRDGLDFVITVGGNISGDWSGKTVRDRFETSFSSLISAGVPFFASLGKYDSAEQRRYPLFNMGGQRYYLVRRGNADFFALDSNYLDPAQLDWLRHSLSASTATWKIVFFHHPLYSSGKPHGSSEDLQRLLEPLFQQYGVRVVFTGHDHMYERIKPQGGITYFVCGSSGQSPGRYPDVRSPKAAAGFYRDQAFLTVRIAGDQLAFRAITRTGAVVDAGEIRR